uniref:Uncharacterized protein n=1 Tax=viral metagenome TaxID=1070528 RepID=A0A6M3JJF1_9ZZZZ
MPYTNIVFIKLFLSLFEEDDRFLYQLNESQQLLYIKLLYMAGSTQNKITKNLRFIAHKVNYHHEDTCMVADIKRIIEIFPKFKEGNEFYYFENFNELHNWFTTDKSKMWKTKEGKPYGSPIGSPNGSVKNKNKNKNKIYNTPLKNKFLDFVLLAPEEHTKLVVQFGEQGANDRIGRLNDYIGSKGAKYASHYHTILNWARKDQPTEKINRKL